MSVVARFAERLALACASFELDMGEARRVVEPYLKTAHAEFQDRRLSRRRAEKLLGEARTALSERARELGRPRLDRRCDDCAFSAGSPERAERPEVLRTIVGHLDAALAGTGPWVPFYCHKGMALDLDGNYVPKASQAGGAPADAPLCAGWVEELDRRQAAVQEPRCATNSTPREAERVVEARAEEQKAHYRTETGSS